MASKLIILLTMCLNLSMGHKIAFLMDYLQKIDGPRNVESHLCWSQEKRGDLQKMLSNIEYANILKTTELLEDELDLFYRTFITDMECPFFDELMEMAFIKELYKYPHKWMIFGNVSNLVSKKLYLPLNSYITVVEEIQPGTFSIKSVYQLNAQSDYFQESLGTWTRGNILLNKLSIIVNRTNLHKMPLRVSYVMLDNSSLYGIYDNRNKHVDKLTKINYLMFNLFVDIWNMTHDVIIQQNWGLEFHPVKLYSKGMLGDLCYGKADVAGTLSFTPPDRFKYFRYLVSTLKGFSLYFVFMAPPLPVQSNLFALPFDKSAWIGCFVVLCLCFTVIFTIFRWEAEERSFVEDRDAQEENTAGLCDILMMQVGVVCQMDYFHEPRSSSGKIATFTFLIVFSYLYTAFSARIVILLQSTAENLNDVKDLYEAKMDMGVEDNPYNRFYFTKPHKRTNEELRALLYESKIAPRGTNPNFYSATEGMRMVQQSMFAFHVELSTASNLIEASFTDKERCAIRMVETIFKADSPHLSCPRNSTLTEFLLIGFHRLFETGLHSRESRRKFSKVPKCTGKGSIFVSVGMVESYFAYEIFAAGVFLSLFVFLMENVMNRYWETVNKKRLSNVVPTSHGM